MSANKLVSVVCLALIIVGSFLFSTKNRQSVEEQASAEPDIAAGHGPHNRISFTRKEPLNFGALAGGDSIRYIELSPDGEVLTSGQISDQSNHSYIGDINSQKGSGNPRYRIQPGRLTVKVASARSGNHVLLRFLPGELKSGVNLSKLDIYIGPDTNGVELVSGYRRPNEIMFRVSGNHKSSQHRCWRVLGCRSRKVANNVEIDLLYGGRLKLAGHLNSEVAAHMDVRVSVGDFSRHFLQ